MTSDLASPIFARWEKRDNESINFFPESNPPLREKFMIEDVPFEYNFLDKL